MRNRRRARDALFFSFLFAMIFPTDSGDRRLASLPVNDLVLVANALAFVRVWLALLTDIGGDLPYHLLVDTRHHDARLGTGDATTDADVDTLRGRVVDHMGETRA